MKKMIYMFLGYISVGLGLLGTVLPVFPTFPFLMLAAFCFARASKKLELWFKGTKLYQDNLADFVQGKGMTRKAKCRIMLTVTLLMSIGLIMMGLKGIVAGCVVLGSVWIFHLIYFIFGIKTIPASEKQISERKNPGRQNCRPGLFIQILLCDKPHTSGSIRP